MLYLSIKAFHVVAVISWMAGLLYLPRLFVYHSEAEPGGEASRLFKVMERRLLRGIMNPAAAASVIAGAWLAWEAHLWSDIWFQLKAILVLALLAVHVFLAASARAFEMDANTHSGRFYRIVNEVPAVLMLGIVALVIIKPLS